MKWLASSLSLALLFSSACFAVDGGGRDVSVAMFSTHQAASVTVYPLNAQAWIAKCEHCAHVAFTSPQHIEGDTELFAGGALRLVDEALHEERAATGLWHLRSRHGRGVDVVLTLPSERYVAAVLNAEVDAKEPAQSLQAMAILARTYALNGRHFVAQPGHLAADLCDSTQCQAMRLGPVSKAIDDAVHKTAGETLWFRSARAEVYFSQSCGGVTEDAGAIWPRLKGTSYLSTHADPFCVRRNATIWHAEIPLATLLTIAKNEGWKLPADVVSVQIVERSASHRALKLAFIDKDGARAYLSASALRFGIGRALGWNRIRSDAYEAGLRNNRLVFDGKGHGHGVGLCQLGATEMAAEGKRAREILSFYLPGTSVRILPADSGWQETQAGSLRLLSTKKITDEQAKTIHQAWADAQSLFSPKHAIVPEILLAPSTELFRQMTMQPGWALASTQAATIVLQPEEVLQANGVKLHRLLLHEMLHVLVEAEAGERAPLWLREGMVETLAGEHDGVMNLSADAIDAALLHANSWRSSQQAHAAAATKVRQLIGRYGFSTVRGWLSSGVPSGAA